MKKNPVSHLLQEERKFFPTNNLSKNARIKNLQEYTILYQRSLDPEEQLHEQVCRFANVLKTLEVTKGGRVCIYLPTIPEAAIAMLACARTGTIHSVVFAGFIAESPAHRIHDATCKVLVISNVAIRAAKHIPLKEIADAAPVHCPSIEGDPMKEAHYAFATHGLVSCAQLGATTNALKT